MAGLVRTIYKKICTSLRYFNIPFKNLNNQTYLKRLTSLHLTLNQGENESVVILYLLIMKAISKI